MPRDPWNKGLTKETSVSVRKISQTMRAKKIDNFAQWREQAKREGLIRSEYPVLKKDGDLAELIGVVLGDGHIGIFPRTECLRIVANASNKGFIKRYTLLVEKIFDQKPYVKKRNDSNAVDIRIYQKHISKRLGVPSGARKDIVWRVPAWVLANEEYIVRYLRGLYEAEGCFCAHRPTYTYKFIFANLNRSLLSTVYVLWQQLGFHPHKTVRDVQISKREESYRAKELIKFRSY